MSRASRVLPTPMAGERAKTISVGLGIGPGEPFGIGAGEIADEDDCVLHRPAEIAVAELVKRGGFEVTTVEGYKQDSRQLDFSFLTPEYLNQFDGVMMMTNGNLPFSDAQKTMLVDFVRGGKGFIGAHCASLTFYNYPEFGEMLGGYFHRNLPQGTVAVLKVEDRTHPATKMLGASWPLVDEFYLFGSAPWNRRRMLLPRYA